MVAFINNRIANATILLDVSSIQCLLNILMVWREMKHAIKPLPKAGLKAIIRNFERTFAYKIWKT
jgi:hypothetical protein